MRMTGFDMCDVDLLDEEYLGPPPRFLIENNPRDFSDAEPDFALLPDGGKSPLAILKNIFGKR